VFCSGQVGVNPATGQFNADDVPGQTQQAIHNLSAVLAAAGTDLAHVVKTTVFLTDIDTFKEMNEVYDGIFGEVTKVPPARSTVGVNSLPRDALVEIEAIAVKP
jgi:2-iminobutanoate/2-iminopropanoate deaminase